MSLSLKKLHPPPDRSIKTDDAMTVMMVNGGSSGGSTQAADDRHLGRDESESGMVIGRCDCNATMQAPGTNAQPVASTVSVSPL